MSIHQKFILTPISSVLQDALSASAGIGEGIETFPLCHYILQSAFLKMTGFQEQKMKCVFWELGTNDYEYRYNKFFKSANGIGECSSLNEKNIVYVDLVKQIKKVDSSWNLSKIRAGGLLLDAKGEMRNLFDGTNWVTWQQEDYNTYCDIVNGVKMECFLGKDNIFMKCDNCPKNGKKKGALKCINELKLNEAYEKLYRHRNRCAHNTLSYQSNLPTLNTLASDDYKYENYFVRFFLLMLIDNIIVELYKEYVRVLEDAVM